MPLERCTRATFRRAEFGFLGVMILTWRQTPRFCGQPSKAGCFGLRYCWRRGLRTSWLIVGILLSVSSGAARIVADGQRQSRRRRAGQGAPTLMVKIIPYCPSRSWSRGNGERAWGVRREVTLPLRPTPHAPRPTLFRTIQAMKRWLRRWGWTVGKAVLALAILVGVGQQFYHHLKRLDPATLPLRPGWLALAAGLYLLGLGGSAWFWVRLLRTFGERPAGLAAVRAYYISHLGKYAPGKAWALLLRGELIRGPDVRFGVAILSAFYEVLTTMAAGALLAAVLFAASPPAALAELGFHPVLVGVL